MALTIKDGAGATTALNTSLAGGEHTPYHAISGTVSITSSLTNPVAVTGTVTVGSITDPVVLSADVYGYPGFTYGALITKVTASDTDPVHVTSSFLQPLFVSSSSGREVWVASSPGTPVYVSSSEGNVVFVSASTNSPVPVTSSGDKPVFVVNDSAKPIFVTSSDAFPVVTKNTIATSTSRTGFSSYAGTINWAGTGSADISGTFILAQSSSTRKGLMFANNTNKDLYIALGDNDFAATNGFLLSNTASSPVSYSFILYPSGTYFAETTFANIKHSGFFISSSNIDVTINVITTE